MLKLTHISKTFNPGTVNAKKAIEDLSFHAAKGDFITVIGAKWRGQIHALQRYFRQLFHGQRQDRA